MARPARTLRAFLWLQSWHFGILALPYYGGDEQISGNIDQARAFDIPYLRSLETTLEEWSSPEYDAAYADL